MNKAITKEVNRYLSMAEEHSQYAANALAILQRSAPTIKAINELNEIIQTTGLSNYLDYVDGCYIPRH